ncbi:hypothetical protein BpHYR1_031265 [Brachionus plicatilis]|uniref:RING-type domain-containing protein n=1 Tax=Brachionus plicatilis TaxID=10195 RepID=A0A3M7R1E3_BRAPC|nr:hypothetical protein BpHYR1_031265 [Brachionus plicatilis]
MQCEYCNEKEDDKGLFSLPCGYLVCSHHIESAEDYFNCFVCDEHMINRQREEVPQVKMSKLFGTIDLRDSNETFGGKTEKSAHFKTLSNEFQLIAKVGLEEILELSSGEVVFTSKSKKSNLLIFNPQNGKTKEINGQHEIEYFFKTDNDEIIIIDSEYHVKIWYDFKCVNTFDIVRKNYRCVELEVFPTFVLVFLILKLGNVKNIKKYTSTTLETFLPLKKLIKMSREFFEGEEEPQVKMSKLFGTIDLRDSNDTFGRKTGESDNSKSNEFKLIAQVGLQNNFELSSGEVVFTSQSKISNLLIFNPQIGNICEVPTQHDIKYLFKSDNNEIIIIDSEFHVKIWNNFKCVNNYYLVRKNLIYAELVEEVHNNNQLYQIELNISKIYGNLLKNSKFVNLLNCGNCYSNFLFPLINQTFADLIFLTEKLDKNINKMTFTHVPLNKNGK